jgi:KAP-like P-loop domain-containing protein
VHLYPPELEIAPGEGFTPEKDIFGRREFGEQLTRLIESLEDPVVLLLDGKWGSGKTVFVKMWLGELTKQGIPNIYFDAFANDYHEDAFLSIAGEILARAEEQKPKSRRAIDGFRTQAFGVAKALARASVKIGVRAASAGLLTGEELADVTINADAAKAIGDEAAKALDDLIKERLDSHAADRETFKRFREALNCLAEELASPPEERHGEGEAQKPLVFVIDELDRCRPPFALELLEKIKHFFSVPRVVFVLVSSLSQLETAARFAYGDIDALTYLEKFFHLRLLFPAGRPDRPDMGAARYLGRLLQQLPPASNNYNEIIQRFCRIRPLSFRTLERIHAYLVVTTASMRKNSVFFPEVIAVLCVLKVIEPRVYDAARAGTLKYEQLGMVLNFESWREQHNPNTRDRLSERLENLWRYLLGGPLPNDVAQKVAQDERFFTFEYPGRVVTYYCELIDCFALAAN